MPITFKKRFKPDEILDELAEARTVGGDGSVSFSDFSIHQAVPILHSMLSFPDITADIDTAQLVWSGVLRAKEPLNQAQFLAAINAELKKFLSQREETFHVLSTMSLNPTGLPHRFSFLGTKFTLFASGFPRKYASREKVVADLYRSNSLKDNPEKYVHVRVEVQAKTAHQASTKASRSLDLWRAIVCLRGNNSMQIKLAGADYEPINCVRLGTCNTVHRSSGEIAMETIWFDPTFTPIKPKKFDNPNNLRRHLHFASKRIDQSPYSSTIKDALIKYVRSLDEPDPETAFIRLWGAIENLASPSIANYDAVVRRCSFFYTNRDYHAQILEHLREFRNSSVHRSAHANQARINCYLAQEYFNTLFWFHARNATYFTSLDEANGYLDLVSRRENLRRERDLLNKAIRFFK